MSKPGRAATPWRPTFRLARIAPSMDPDVALEIAADLVASANAARATAGTALVGPLSVARTRYDDDAIHHLQLSSQPLADYDGGEFRFRVVAGHPMEDEAEVIEEIREAERRFTDARPYVAPLLRRVRGIVSTAIAKHGPGDALASIVAIGCEFPVYSGSPELYVDLEMLGHSLTTGVERIHAAHEAHLAEALATRLSSHSERASRLSILRRDGACGLMEKTVPLVLASAGMDLEFALDRLEKRNGFTFLFGRGRRMRGHIGWSEGVLEVSFRDLAREIEFSPGLLRTTSASLPETIMAALPGRSLDVLLTHACLPGDAIITHASKPPYSPGPRFTLQVGVLPVPIRMSSETRHRR